MSNYIDIKIFAFKCALDKFIYTNYYFNDMQQTSVLFGICQEIISLNNIVVH